MDQQAAVEGFRSCCCFLPRALLLVLLLLTAALRELQVGRDGRRGVPGGGEDPAGGLSRGGGVSRSCFFFLVLRKVSFFSIRSFFLSVLKTETRFPTHRRLPSARSGPPSRRALLLFLERRERRGSKKTRSAWPLWSLLFPRSSHRRSHRTPHKRSSTPPAAPAALPCAGSRARTSPQRRRGPRTSAAACRWRSTLRPRRRKSFCRCRFCRCRRCSLRRSSKEGSGST